jgi:sugar O-acyltransferase (sialic acid O-acetyltransferase NeuD family)
MKTIKNPIQKIVIVGARMDGQAGVILDVLDELGGYEVVGFVDSTPELQNTSVKDIPVVGLTEDLDTLDLTTNKIHIAIGNNIVRYKLFKLLKKRNFKLITIIHPGAVVSRNAVVGEGSFIGPLAVVNCGVEIGCVSFVNTGAIIEHDNKIGNAVHIAPGVLTGGRVRVDDYSFVGLGATVIPDVRIGSGVMIGAGATVTKDVPPNTTMIGYAAKVHYKNIYMVTEPDVKMPDKVYVAQPTLPDYDRLETKFCDIIKGRMLSNFAKYSNQFELNVQQFLSVKKALSFPNATTALMLALRVLDLSGEVILPSFTFAATGHAVGWNNLTPVFADIDPQTFNLDPDDVERRITERTSAIIAVHIFGNPCNINRLEFIANKHNLKLIFDSAHALGSKFHGKMIGSFGDCECFSLSGTKVITSAEGGLVTSEDEALMQKMSIGRNYGATDDYNCQYIGLNGKMSEFHAAIAVESLTLLPDFVSNRNKLAQLYQKRLSEIPGISFQCVSSDNTSTYKDFAILIDKDVFGMDRNELMVQLEKENIITKRYFYPPLHKMTAYQTVNHGDEDLANTMYVANNIICLPIYSHMNVDTLEKICYTIYRIHLNTK